MNGIHRRGSKIIHRGPGSAAVGAFPDDPVKTVLSHDIDVSRRISADPVCISSAAQGVNRCPRRAAILTAAHIPGNCMSFRLPFTVVITPLPATKIPDG